MYVFPIPGSHFASPQTQITFRGLPGGAARDDHGHRVEQRRPRGHDRRATRTATAAASSPSRRPFTPGETVTVSTSLNIEGSHNGTYQFQVAMPAGAAPVGEPPAAPRVNGDVWCFQSRPDLTPAAVTITKPDPAAAGDIFLAPQIGPLQQGPEIIGPNGGLIWFDPVPTRRRGDRLPGPELPGPACADLVAGQRDAPASGIGQDIIMNSSYQVIEDALSRQRAVRRPARVPAHARGARR